MKIKVRAILWATLTTAAIHILIDVIGSALTPLLPSHPFVDKRSLIIVLLIGGLFMVASFMVDAGGGILYVFFHARGSIPSVGTGATGGAVAGIISRLLALTVHAMMRMSALAIHILAGTQLSIDTLLHLILGYIFMLLFLPIAGIAFGGIGGALATAFLAKRRSAPLLSRTERTRSP